MEFISIDFDMNIIVKYYHEDSTWRNYVREKFIGAPVVFNDRNIKINHQQYCERNLFSKNGKYGKAGKSTENTHF